MKVEKLKLSGFRNLSDLRIIPHSRLNIFYGGNGAGKTNLCESLYFASTGRPLRGRRQRELIRWGGNELLIRISLENGDTLVVYLTESNSKQIKLNEKNESQGKIKRKLPVISFVPTDLNLIKGGPGKRRELLNVHLESLSTDYSKTLKDYRNELKKKNALLKKEKINREFLKVLNERTQKLGTEISFTRYRFIKRLNQLLEEKYKDLSNSENEVSLTYDSLPGGEGSRKKISESLEEKLEEKKSKEIERETSLVGPHRDKINYRLDGRDLRKFGSQGQQRTAVVATKLSLITIYKERFDSFPLLLLDDIFSELDPERAEHVLLNLPAGAQTFVTSAEPLELENLLDFQPGLFYLSDGEVRRDD